MEVESECLFCSRTIKSIVKDYDTCVKKIRSNQKSKVSHLVWSSGKLTVLRSSAALCLSCGFEGVPKVKSSRWPSAKKLGLIGVCFPPCVMALVRYAKRERVSVVCSQCKCTIVKINMN